ncbi:uncharacterized protein LOC129594976 isoform X2 [Paramacrobiotus metropolitanus]|uniref:uncharacterized protein LOC129594976 isoform X2 n=1 Tax=Paramacrobiotus metropolitanus TaxID=2943436 RepID=UPI0024460F3F|nr:uncharacterized protein LOC129594976 isoform X2 [Paramacrobiotus metropolitanus]
MEPNASLHVSSRSASPAARAPAAVQRVSSKAAAKSLLPTSSSLSLGGRPSVNKENTPSHGGCGHCSRNVLDEPCPLHSHSVPDAEVIPLALATLPSSFSFIRTPEDELPCGVRAQCSFPARTVFGPMRGVLCPHAKLQQSSFGIPDRPTLQGILRFHADSPHGCNWMQFVRLAIHTAECNLTAYNVDGQVYFATKRDIAAGEELKVWYSFNYARALGISGRLQEISNKKPVRHRKNMKIARPTAYVDDLVPASGLPDSFPSDEHITPADAVDRLPAREDLTSHAEAINEEDSDDTDSERDAGDSEEETASEEEDGEAEMPSAVDAGDGGNDPAVSTAIPRKKRKRPFRFRHDNPEAVKRLEAVVQVNPYQYAPGNHRNAAFDSVVRLLGPEAVGNTRGALKTFVHFCLAQAADAQLRFNDAAGPVFQRYMELLNTLTDMKKNRVTDVRLGKLGSRRQEAIEELKAVVEVNPYQYKMYNARYKAFDQAVQNLQIGTKDASPMKSGGRRKTEGRKLEVRVNSRLEQLPKLLEQCDPTTGADSLMEYLEVLQKVAELKDNGARFVQRAFRMSNSVAQRTKPATEGLHVCTACMFSFESAALLALHTRGHDAAAVEEGGATACPGCQEECGTMAALIAHVEKHRKTYRPREKCAYCELYVSVKFMGQHLRNVHPEKSADPVGKFTCGECQKEYASQKQLTAHEMHHRAKRCLYCAQLFPSWPQLGYHAVMHRQDEGFLCPHCPKTFDTYLSLSRHNRRLHNAKAVCACSVCGDVKRNRYALGMHMLKHGIGTVHQHPCPLCGKSFHSRWKLERHRNQVHSGGRSGKPRNREDTDEKPRKRAAKT